LNYKTSSQENVFTDLCHGEVFKKVSATVKTDEFLQIILYQDTFEIDNPLGSAKKVHKILAVYMAAANFPPHVRTSIDNLQLVLLCKEKDVNNFGQEQVFDVLIQDLKTLENDGILIDGVKVEVRLICILGDNLGSHWLGDFCANFSTNKFFCRYCLVRKEGHDIHSICHSDEIRTPENYNKCTAFGSITSPCKGVVRQSSLNQLNYFHVCGPGLPPCLGHDLLKVWCSMTLHLF
jgi:hypothetical protein